MYLVAIINNAGLPKNKVVANRDEAETWLLSLMENEGVKYYRIKNKDTGELVETNIKVYKKKGE